MTGLKALLGGISLSAILWGWNFTPLMQMRYLRCQSGAEQDLTEPLPFRNGIFDMVISSLTLHYVEEWGPTFQEFHRVLKPGGYLFFSVNHPFMDFNLFKRENYFTRELLEDVWRKKESGRVEVTFFRKTLAEITNVTAEHFSVEQIVEPQPTSEFMECFPDQLR